jgi:hypothetical protein
MAGGAAAGGESDLELSTADGSRLLKGGGELLTEAAALASTDSSTSKQLARAMLASTPKPPPTVEPRPSSERVWRVEAVELPAAAPAAPDAISSSV